MAVTVTAELVAQFTGETRPPNHAGWNNPAGDPGWVKDVDWFRRFRLTAAGPEVGGIVNWEIFDGSIPLKTTAEINALADGSLGRLINNTTTWTVWSYTGTNVAGKAYVDTKSSAISTLRANGPITQVLLGNRPAARDVPPPTFKVYAFLPGSGKTPAGTATIALQPPTVVVSPASASVEAGATTQLTAAVTPAEASQDVTWVSSDSAVASVDASGLVTGVAAGTATITATSLTFVGTSGTSAITVTAVEVPPPAVRVIPETPVEDAYPEGGTIAEIKAWVGDDEDRAQDALDAEAAKDNPRVTLIEYLEGMLGIDA